MTAVVRRPRPPIIIDQVVPDGETVRAMAHANGPYWQPGRMLATSGAAKKVADKDNSIDAFATAPIGPTFRGEWAFGESLVDGADALLHHPGFTAAAAEMYETDVVVPEQVYVNINTPIGRQGFSHTDVPEFRGVDRQNAPAWLLLAMGASRLFEAERIHIVTAVSWFYKGEAGGLRYWPEGPDGPSILHDNTWNTAVVGDNDFMPHEVMRVGPRGAAKPEGMTILTELHYRGDDWAIVDGDTVLATYPDESVRLSLSWKAKVYRDQSEREAVEDRRDGISIDEAISRLGDDVARAAEPEDLAGRGIDSMELRDQLTRRYSTYVPTPRPEVS